MLTGARPASVALAVAVGLTLGLAPAGCDSRDAVRTSPDPAMIPVVASIDSWGSLLGQLGGSRVHELSIISTPEENSPHYRPTAAEVAAIAGARVLVVNGIGYDSWATAVAAAHPSADRTVVNIGEVVGVGATGNPNQSYSRAAVHKVVDAITAALQAADPDGSLYFAARRTTFRTTALAPLDALETTIRQHYSGVAVGANSTTALPLAESVGLDLVTPRSFLVAVGAGDTPTAADLATISDQISDHRIAVYLDDVGHSTPAVAAQVRAAEKADVPVVTLTETLSPKDATFQAWQVEQLTALRTALGQKH